jgi:hypothetical protein
MVRIGPVQAMQGIYRSGIVVNGSRQVLPKQASECLPGKGISV